jgi:hypothetical protein
MQFWYQELWADNSGESPFSETGRIELPSTDVLVLCGLQQVNQLESEEGQAQIAVTKYVQDGDLHEGSWPILQGNNITEVIFTLTVVYASAQGTGLILAINE